MKNNNFEWTKELLQQYLDNKNYQKLNIQDKHDETGFMYACMEQPQLAEIMLQKADVNIDFNIQNNLGFTGFMMACIHQPQLAEIMLQKDNIDFNVQNNFGHTGFMMACRVYPELLKKMLENNKIDQNLEDQEGITGYDMAKGENLKSFEIYQAWLEQKNINNQVQKRTKKPRQHL